MQPKPLFTKTLALLILALTVAASPTAVPGEPTPSFSKHIPLPGTFDYVRLVPGKRQSVLISRQVGLVILVNLDQDSTEHLVETGHPVVDVVVSRDGRFAYLLGIDENVDGARLWRVDLTNSSHRSILLPLNIVQPRRLALRSENQILIVGPETTTLTMLDTNQFNDERTSVIAQIPKESFNKPIPLGFGVGDITTLPGYDLVFLSRTTAPEIYGFDLQAQNLRLYTSIYQTRDTYRPLELVLAKGRKEKRGSSIPTTVVGDEVGGRIMIFELNRSFRALDFVTQADIAEEDGALELMPKHERAQLVIAASDDLSAILVANRSSSRVHFFSLVDNVLKQLNRWDQGPAVDLDVAVDGRLAVILVGGGNSLMWVERPNAAAPFKQTGGNPKILAVQKRLIALGFLLDAADGILGDKTIRAIELFQKSQGFKQTGTLDDQTISKLMESQDMLILERTAFEERFRSGGENSLMWVERPDAVAPFKQTGGNPRILAVQKRLIALGFLLDAADGILGDKTIRAIKLFQKSQGLKQTGTLDDQTISKLMEPQDIFILERTAFEERFRSQGIQHFQPEELLITGNATGCKEFNRFPPKRTWCNAFEIAKVMAEFRARWDHPVKIKAAYRSPEYSNCVGDEKGLAYTEFRAVDFHSTGGSPAVWATLLKQMQSEGLFKGKIEAHTNLVHLELHQAPELWVIVGKRNKKGDFESPYFNIHEPPTLGDILKPIMDMRLRASSPTRKDGSWVIAETVSRLRTHLALTVDRVEIVNYPLGLVQYWAGGRVLFDKPGLEGREPDNWFVVVESHPNEEQAIHAAKVLKKAHPDLSLEVYLDEYNWYSIVSRTNLNQEEAKKRVLEVRCAGVSDDAFAWPPMDWKTISEFK